MPELPEVEVVRRGLAPAVSGARVTGVDVLDARSLKRHRDASGAAHNALDFVAGLEGMRLVAPERRGKFLWVPIATETAAPPKALVAHLGMSGQLLVRLPSAQEDRHTRIRVRVEAPHGTVYEVRFADQRRFGSLAVDSLVPDPTHPEHFVPSQVLHIARDPLDELFDADAVRAKMRATSRAVKTVLLDQRVVSGIGNIYADEALWRARVHWAKPANRLSTRKVNELLSQTRLVMDQALAEGGTSFDALYVNVNGESGYFARSLNVYGRSGKACNRCGASIVREAFANRSSYRCPRCQRLR